MFFTRNFFVNRLFPPRRFILKLQFIPFLKQLHKQANNRWFSSKLEVILELKTGRRVFGALLQGEVREWTFTVL